MNTSIFQHKALALGLGAMLCIASCSDWDDHYESNSVEGANTSLWDEISQRPELSDFSEVLQKTNVFRMHRKSSASYAEVISGGQSLTIFAPVNGTFNKDSILQLVQTAEGDSAVERFFIMNHISRTPHSAVLDTIRTLNNKRTYVSESSVNGIAIKESNKRCKNGILHVMESQIPYNHTIYEALNHHTDLLNAGKIISSYNEDEFDEDKSVSSGLVNGIPVYVDSVVYETNKLMDAIGYLNAEDSTYYACVPTNQGWDKAWAEASTYFQFPTSMEKRDSLQKYYTARALFNEAVFSRTIQANEKECVRSKWYSNEYPEYSIYNRPFDSDGLFGKAQGKHKCSNGTLFYYDEWPYEPEMTYFRKIETEAENTGQITSFSQCIYSTRSLNADSISKGRYLYITPTTGTANWKLTYKINGTLSGDYDIYVVVLPKFILGPDANKRPCQFNVNINYIKEDGSTDIYKCNNGKTFNSNGYKVDSILVAENFHFPACNYGENNEKVTIEIACNINPKQSGSYNREMFLDAIILKPKRQK